MKCTVKVNNQRLSGPSLCRSPFRKLNTESSIGASQSTNQKQEWPVAARFVNGSALNERCYKGPSKDASYQVLIHLAKRFQRRFFQKSTNQKQEWPVVAMFVNESRRNEHSLQRTFHRCCLPCFGSFGQAASEEKIKKNRPIRNQNCRWRPCLSTDQDEMSIFIESLPQMLPTKFQFI